MTIQTNLNCYAPACSARVERISTKALSVKGIVGMVLLISVLLSACSPSLPSGAGSTGTIAIKEAWLRAALTVGGDGHVSHDHSAEGDTKTSFVSSGYMTIDNSGDAPDTLVSVATDAAEVVEIHESKEVNGMMSMEPLPNGLEIPAKGRVVLKPGSFHLMIMRAKKEAFTAGKSVKMSFKFKSGSEINLDVPVRENK